MTWIGEQIGTFNSKLAIERGFGPYDLDEIVDEFHRLGSYVTNRDIINRYVKNSGKMLDHLVEIVPDNSDFFSPAETMFHQGPEGTQYPIVQGGVKTWAGTLQFRGPLKLQRAEKPVNEAKLPALEMFCLRRSREMGAEWRFETKGVALLRDGKRITGAAGRTKEGKFFKYIAKKGVVLATGKFSGNGVELAAAAGGQLELDCHMSVPMYNVCMAYGWTPFLMLNARGDRFCNESSPYSIPYAMSMQPPGKICAVTDASYMKQMSHTGLQHGNPDFSTPEYIRQFVEDMEEAPKYGADGYLVRDTAFAMRVPVNKMYAAGTLSELADYIGYAGQAKNAFLASIKKYNESCENGKDGDYNKDQETLIPIEKPPFYATFVVKPARKDYPPPMPLLPPRALMTDKYCNVLDEDCREIEGLYAIGDNLGGRYGIFYIMPCGGTYIGTAMTLGRETGLYLAGK